MRTSLRMLKHSSEPENIGPLQRCWLQGETITQGSISVTPISRRWSLGLPTWCSQQKDHTFIIQQPAAVIVQQGERTQTIPIYDLQQIILLTLFGLTLVCLGILFRPKRSMRPAQNVLPK